MASGNDPANIAYIIVENGFYYVAYKEKVKVPEVVVSDKGVANGLSEEYNDGWDFGPDSYDPTSTSNPPYTQTTGTQEALDYLVLGGEVKLLAGAFGLSVPVQWYKNTIPDNRTGAVDLPPITISGVNMYPTNNVNDPSITGTLIYPTSSFPSGEYMLQINPFSTTVSTYASSIAKSVIIKNISFNGAVNATGNTQYASDISGLAIDACTIEHVQSFFCVNSFNLQNVNGVGGNNNIIDCVVYSPATNGVYHSVGQSVIIGVMLYNGGTTNTTSAYAFTVLSNTMVIGCSVQNYAGNGYYLGTYVSVLSCSSATYTVGLNYFTVDGDYNVITGNTFTAPVNGGSILYIISGSVNMYGNVITLVKNIGYIVYRASTTIQKRSVIRNNTIHFNGYTYNPYPIGDKSNNGDTLYVMDNAGFNPTAPFTVSAPSSGAVTQNNGQYDYVVSVPITFPTTADTAVTAYLRVGSSSTSGANPIVDQFSEPATLATANGRIWTLRGKVPVGQYYEIDVTNATIGTVQIIPE